MLHVGFAENRKTTLFFFFFFYFSSSSPFHDAQRPQPHSFLRNPGLVTGIDNGTHVLVRFGGLFHH